jgi:hypothetical protein
VEEHVEEKMGHLIEGFMGQHDDEVRSVMVKVRWRRWSSVWSKWRHAEVELDGAKCCGQMARVVCLL